MIERLYPVNSYPKESYCKYRYWAYDHRENKDCYCALDSELCFGKDFCRKHIEQKGANNESDTTDNQQLR